MQDRPARIPELSCWYRTITATGPRGHRPSGWFEKDGRLAKGKHLRRIFSVNLFATRHGGVASIILHNFARIRSADAALPPALVHTTVQAAVFAAAGGGTAQGLLSPGALTLARGVMQSMFWSKVKTGATVLLVAVISTGASGLTYRVLADLGQQTPAP